MFRLENVSKTFINADNTTEAVRHVTLEIKDGEIFGIIGLSGAGKSTLVRCLNFLERPTEGKVYFQGEDLSAMEPAKLREARKKMSMIFQDFNLLEQRTALGNVLYPLEISGYSKKNAAEKARKLLARVGLEDKENSYPSQLSGGQKQRVAIARALALDPEALLCDEATSALDPTTTEQILQLLKEINEELGVTIVIITHAMNVVTQICDRVAVMADGEIAEIGDVKEVFVLPKSEVARKMILPKSEAVAHLEGNRFLRLVFDGQDAFEPIVSNLVIHCHTPVNILAADTKVVGDLMFGQMILQIPDDDVALARIKDYLDGAEVTYEEVQNYAG